MVSIKKIFENKKEDIPEAQTTHLASFGPILIIAAHPNPPRTVTVSKYIEPKNHKLVQKKARLMVPRAQMTHFESFGLVLVIATHANIRRAVNIYIEPKKVS